MILHFTIEIDLLAKTQTISSVVAMALPLHDPPTRLTKVQVFSHERIATILRNDLLAAVKVVLLLTH